MTQDRVEAIQAELNKYAGLELVDERQARLTSEIKELIHAYNLRGDTLKHLFKQAVYFRRLWRKQPIDPKAVGSYLTFVRQVAYRLIRKRG